MDAVSDGLLLMTPGVRGTDISFLAIVDNNGVPRWVMRPNGRARNFRRYPDGRYSFSERDADRNEPTVILDAGFNRIDTATLVGTLLAEHTGGHDFLITESGNYLLMSYYPAVRDLSDFGCPDGDGPTRQCSTAEPAGRLGDPGSDPGRGHGIRMELLGPRQDRGLHDPSLPERLRAPQLAA